MGADLVVTGEGSFDAQSLAGKAPVGVARRARAAGVPVVVLAGQVALDEHQRAGLDELGIVAVHALLDLEPDPLIAQRDAADLLRRLAARVLTVQPAVARMPTRAAPVPREEHVT